MSFFQELQRRKVIRTLVAYLAAAFVTAQAADLLVSALDLPASILTIVVVLEIVALPFVVLIAWFYDASTHGLRREDASAPAIAWRRVLIPAGLVLLAVGLGMAVLTLRRSEKQLDDNLVVVLPFRVTGSADVSYLREGMVDLLAAKLTGEGGPRAADPRTVMSAWRSAVSAPEDDLSNERAIEVAAELGAGQVLHGSVVGNNALMTITASLLDVTSGKSVEAATKGNADSLTSMIDHLTAELLSLRAGENQQRLATLTSTSLPALRSYLNGQAAYREARFTDAIREFGSAIETDSTFALAAMGFILATGWDDAQGPDQSYAHRALIANLKRLGPVDRAMAFAQVGDAYPDRRTRKEKLRAWENVIALAPDRADAWFIYGDMHMHYGAQVEIGDADTIARRAFRRALALDSSMTPALLHLIDNAIIAGNNAELRRLDGIRELRAPDESTGRYQFAIRSRALGDSAGLRALRMALDTVRLNELFILTLGPYLVGGALDDAILAMDVWDRRVTTSAERAVAYGMMHLAYLNFGMPGRAAAMLDKLRHTSSDSLTINMQAVFDGLYANGDRAYAERAAGVLRRMTRSADPKTAAGAGCAVDQWDLWNGRPGTGARTIQSLRSVPGDDPDKFSATTCALLLDALYAGMMKAGDARLKLDALDAFLRDGPAVDAKLLNVANAAAGRLYEQQGDRVAALRAIRRRALHSDAQYLFASAIRHEARLRAATGDREGAIQQYQQYLGLHKHAEPALKSEDDAVRRELAQLTGEGSQ